MGYRFIGSNRQIQGGHLATAKRDFNAHVEGQDYFHGAPDILMEPPLPILPTCYNVQTTLENLPFLITSNGTGFISIGDVARNVLGNYNVNSATTPTLDQAFTAAFADNRLQDGGIILLMAGEYTLDTPVTVPPGISIMGEIGGTIIIGEMNEQSMFIVQTTALATTIGGDSGGGEIDLESGAPLDDTRFFNLILADNLNGTVQMGGQPIATMTSVPMIQCEIGSSCTCEEVKFVGRVDNGPINGRSKTLCGVRTSGLGADPSSLTLKRCFFDGMLIAARFLPSNGDVDHLVVDKCRARTFGTEANPFPNNLEDECFVDMSLCNATLVDNYHVGYDPGGGLATVAACFVVETMGGGSSDVDIAIVGNEGGPSWATDIQALFVMPSGETVQATMTGNNWGSCVHNPWYVVVGTNDQAANHTAGDFMGEDAIDTLLNVNLYHPTTVVVTPGTYNVTTKTGGKNYNFVGCKIDNEYPVFELDVSSAVVDKLNNRYFDLGSSIKSIKLRSNVAVTANYHSVHLNWEDHDYVEADDCLFENVALYVPDITAACDCKRMVRVQNCQFYQTGDYSDNVSALLPKSDQVVLENCTFRGNGYVGGIGDAAGIGYTASQSTEPNILVKNCIMDLTGNTISSLSPTGSYRYFWVDLGNDGKVTFENTQILSDNTWTYNENISPVILGPGGFDFFVRLDANEIFIDKCTFNGPDQLKTVGILPYALPTIHVRPHTTFAFNESKIFGGALPLQVSQRADLSKLVKGNISIVNSEFSQAQWTAGPSISTQTLVDIDIDNDSFDLAEDLDPQVLISGNFFTQRSIPFGLVIPQIYHYFADQSYYDGQGVVQVYAPGYSVNVNNNKMFAQLGDSGSPMDHQAGIYVDNYYATSIQNAVAPRKVNIHNNTIDIVNFYEALDPTESVASVWLRSSVIQVHDNNISMYSVDFISPTGPVCCLIVDGEISMDEPYQDGLICDNIFSRRLMADGVPGSLVYAYILLTSTSGRGMVIDNSFDYDTIDFSDTTVVYDGTPDTDRWLVKRNKNQIETFNINTYAGVISNAYSPSTGLPIIKDENTTPTSSDGEISMQPVLPPSYSLELLGGVLGSDSDLYWGLSLFDVLPNGVRLVDAELTGEVYEELDAPTGIIYWDITGVTPGTIQREFDFISDTGPITRTITFGGADTYINNPEEQLRSELYGEDLQAETLHIWFTAITIRYKW